MGPRKPTHYLVVRTATFRRKVLELLAERRRTPHEMAQSIGTTNDNARNILLKMRKEVPKLVYIADFTPTSGSGRRTPIYALGDLPDKTDRSEVIGKIVARESASVRQEVDQAIEQATSRQQTWVSALGL
jgi:hypothetical protein